jgi:hypothetical protein
MDRFDGLVVEFVGDIAVEVVGLALHGVPDAILDG